MRLTEHDLLAITYRLAPTVWVIIISHSLWWQYGGYQLEPRKTITLFILVALLIASLSAGIGMLVKARDGKGPGLEILLPTNTVPPQMKVYVSGRVAAPGVYALKEGDRLVDAIAAAGGPEEGARLGCINLALRVFEQDHFQVPGPGDPCQSSPAAAEAAPDDSRIDLNTASPELLEDLPRIGEALARAIVAHREANGPFSSTEQVMDVIGIGTGIYKGIRDMVYVSAPGSGTQTASGTASPR